MREAIRDARQGPSVTVEKIRRVAKGNLRAFVSVEVGGKFKIHGIRIVQQPGKVAWVSLPQSEWTDRKGKTRYSPIVEFPDNVTEAISEAVLKAWSKTE
jgi:DNA-binding cell septation regulator SpoVG